MINQENQGTKYQALPDFGICCRELGVPGANLARNLTVAGSAKRDLRRVGEREARATRGSGGGAPGKFFGATPFTSWETPYLAVVY